MMLRLYYGNITMNYLWHKTVKILIHEQFSKLSSQASKFLLRNQSNKQSMIIVK